MDLGGLWSLVWPSLLILLGVWWLMSGGGVGAIAIIVIGGIFLAEGLGVIPRGGLGRYWPLILIAAGVWVLVRRTSSVTFRMERHRVIEGKLADGDTVDATAVFGGTERVVTSQGYQGGRAIAVFGGVKIDLRRARFAGGLARLEASATFGSVEVSVPPDWEVRLRGTPVLGGIEDKRRTAVPREGAPVIEIIANAIFGGVGIKD